MNKHLKLFANHTAYEAAKNNLDKPNVVLCQQEDEVHYNPTPQPIAPVGKVQVFANPQCTEYADGQSREIWVRLNQAFGFGEEIEFGTLGDSAHSCCITTPHSEGINDPYSVVVWTDYSSISYRDYTIPFESGEIVYCRDNSGGENWEPWLQNPQVIFE